MADGEGDESTGKLFLGGLTRETTTEMIIEHFMPYGQIVDAVAMKDREGRPRCFGFVTFQDPEALDAVLAEEQQLDGKVLDVKPVVPKEEMRGMPAPRGSYGRPSSRGPPAVASAPTPAYGKGGGCGGGGAAKGGGRRGKGGGDGDLGKLFLGGIGPHTTTQDLIDHFSQFGELTDAVAMTGPDGKPRCFGFVTFESPDVAAEVLSLTHEINGRVIDAKSAVPDGLETQPLPAYEPPRRAPAAARRPAPYGAGPAHAPSRRAASGPVTDKCFVGGLAATCTVEDLDRYFSRYGRLVDCVVMQDKATGKSRGFGFVQFDNFESADLVMQDYEDHRIGGKWIEVKRSVPKEVMGSPSPGGAGKGRGPMPGPMPGPHFGAGGYGPARHQPMPFAGGHGFGGGYMGGMPKGMGKGMNGGMGKGMRHGGYDAGFAAGLAAAQAQAHGPYGKGGKGCGGPYGAPMGCGYGFRPH
eukprot:TRINITY_DN4692_c0_g1_i1.p1 TRINITY_DN4692_c0_g1~~TRINITY_DN4692_c0_g1_i1.p1  ORF type:complete len:501 (-),score=108.59 TRINITY_DN4692_c0_g1_i1:57-1460(-)